MTAESTTQSTTTARQEDEADIRRHIGKIVDGLASKDLDFLRSVYSPDVVSFDVEPPLQHVGLEAKLKNWERAFGVFDELNYELRDLDVTVGDDVAFCHGFGRISGTLNNGAATDGMWVRATFCLRKIDGSWLIVHDQASVPLDPASGRGVTDLQP
ncbi:SnoaL-like domain-containing protein [Planctomonas sp. JC2975]|uniref:YybH family protein n=1 Tax=Planctomonas sp. JC2975 TaxID=2729626 RepID=UPI001473D6B8|nr:nuclear transport factor 2 family protein [Planctomonas sp. JC2975]NNC13834.1 SnoaL-like domain-containing protein [Planctomonas sp. JC2975]